MTLSRCDEADATVPMHVVVLVDKGLYPLASSLKTLKAMPWEGTVIFAGPEDGFGKGIVIADPGATMRWLYPKGLQSHPQGTAFLWTAIICMQDLGRLSSCSTDCSLHDNRCLSAVLAFMDLCCDNLATVQVQKQVEVVELAPNGSMQVGDIPVPYLARARCTEVRLMPSRTRRLAPTPMGELLSTLQDPIERGFRSQITPLVRKPRYDLMGGGRLANSG